MGSITTDSDGYASIVLPYGAYTFKQVTSTKDYYKVDYFKVIIDKYDTRPIYKLLSDSEITARVKIIKKDFDTLDNIVNSDIKFKIYDVREKKYVSFMLLIQKLILLILLVFLVMVNLLLLMFFILVNIYYMK